MDDSSLVVPTRCISRVDNQFGGGRVRDAAVLHVVTEVTALLREASATGIELFGAAAELTQLVGWMSYDMDHQGLAQRFWQARSYRPGSGGEQLVIKILAGHDQHPGQDEFVTHRSAAPGDRRLGRVPGPKRCSAGPFQRSASRPGWRRALPDISTILVYSGRSAG